jgi:hypothetical protein
MVFTATGFPSRDDRDNTTFGGGHCQTAARIGKIQYTPYSCIDRHDRDEDEKPPVASHASHPPSSRRDSVVCNGPADRNERDGSPYAGPLWRRPPGRVKMVAGRGIRFSTSLRSNTAGSMWS